MNTLSNPTVEKVQWPRWLVWSVILCCLLPVVLTVCGIEFGSSTESFDSAAFDKLSSSQQADFLHRTLHGSFTHTLLEWSAFCVALFTAVLAWVHFSMNRNNVVTPVVGTALFFAGCMDAFHTLAADRLIEGASNATNLIPFTWALCRLFHVIITVLGIWIVLRLRSQSQQTSAWYVGLATVLLGFIAYITIHLCSITDRLPQTMFPGNIISRPYDVAPLILFVIAGVTVYRRLHQKAPSFFTYGLLLSLVPDLATQMHMAFGSSALFDHHFNVAHFLKIVSYLVPLTGLILDYNKTYYRQKLAVDEVKLSNSRLRNEIEERELIEHKLRVSESKIRGILETAADAIITIDDRGIIESFNPYAEEMFGYSAEEIIGGKINQLMPAPYADEQDQYIDHYLKTGEKRVIGIGREAVGLRKDGTTFPIDFSVSEIRQGDRRTFTGIVRDITRQKQYENVLARQAAEARMMQRTASLATEASSFEDALRRCVNLVCETTDWPIGHVYLVSEDGSDELIPSDLWYVHENEQYHEFREISMKTTFSSGVGFLGRIMASKTLAWIANVQEDENFLRGKSCSNIGVKGAFGFPVVVSGRVVAVLEFFSSHSMEPDERLLSMLQNVGGQLGLIAERKISEERMARMSAIVDSTDDAILSKSLDGIITSWNAGAEKLYGYTAEEAVGREITFIVPPDRKEGISDLLNRIGHGERIHQYETVRQHKDGHHINVWLTISPITDSDGTIVGVSAIARDITEKKRLDEELKKYYLDLEEARARLEEQAMNLNEQSYELDQRNKALDVSNRELDEFAYVASHDLKEPLQGIHNYATFLIEDYEDKLGDDGKDKLHTLTRLSQRMEELINSLLQYSRVGRTELAIKVVNLDEMLSGVCESVQIRLDELGVQVRVPRPLPTLVCDAARIGEVFRNLITNAMKYNDKPEKWIEVDYQLPREREPIEEREPNIGDDEVLFWVRDNGIGIREKHLDSIFKIFKRLHGRDKFGGGTGAGLTIVKKIIERHGGRIWVESTFGEGCTFYFTLPHRPGSSKETKPSTEPEELQLVGT